MNVNKAIHVQGEEYLQRLTRYVVLNPVRASNTPVPDSIGTEGGIRERGRSVALGEWINPPVLVARQLCCNRRFLDGRSGLRRLHVWLHTHRQDDNAQLPHSKLDTERRAGP